jgi:hypothetical protein
MASSGSPDRSPSLRSRALLLVITGRFPCDGSRACGPSCESAPTTSARMAFIRDVSPGVCAHRRLGHGIAPSVGAHATRTVVRVRRAFDGCSSLPVREPAQWAGAAAASGVLPFRALVPDRMGAGCPVPALVWLARRLPGRQASASGVWSPIGSRMVLEEPPDALLEFPSEVFPSAAPASGLIPGPSSYALSAPLPVGLRCPAPWSLERQRSRLVVSDCLPLWVSRPVVTGR